LGSLESTQEARVTLGYRLGQLLRFFCASFALSFVLLRGHASSLLVLKNVLEETTIFCFERVRTFTIVSAGNNCFFCCCMQIFNNYPAKSRGISPDT